MTQWTFFSVFLFAIAVAWPGRADPACETWIGAHFEGTAPSWPFSFSYDGRSVAEIVQRWKRTDAEESLDEARAGRRIAFLDEATGLEVRCEFIKYRDFPAVEWTLYFKNTGDKPTGILENIQAIDAVFEGTGAVLHHNRGSQATATDYEPLTTPLGAGITKQISAAGGRPSNTDLPFFNIAWEKGGGVLLAVGWPGQWAAEFAGDEKGVRLRAGQELTHFRLSPGEEARSPAMVALCYDGDWVQGQNQWRHWMMAHGMPHPGGKLPAPMMLASSSRAYEEMIKADDKSQMFFIQRFLDEGLKLDYWWMDAGWYVQEKGWPQVGTWEVDTKRFPHGLRPISDYAHERGVKILVWFEPERVAAGTWLSDTHPEWILGGSGGGLLDLGNPEARTWLTDHVDRLITEQGIDLYRQDFNMDPLALWRGNDAEDRQGLTENHHVTGYLAYWDELRRRHPNMLIDTCASGGRRIDLETLRRAVPLWRSDYAFEPIGHQGMMYGLSLWLPYHGTGTVACASAAYYGGGPSPVEPYAFWSNAQQSTGWGIDVREAGLDYEALRALFREWREMSPLYYGDFYPLMPYSGSPSAWVAWQFHDPATGRGFVQAFRRAESPYESVCLPLRGLDPETKYAATPVEGGEPQTATGRDLMEAGLAVALPQKPAAAVVAYEIVK